MHQPSLDRSHVQCLRHWGFAVLQFSAVVCVLQLRIHRVHAQSCGVHAFLGPEPVVDNLTATVQNVHSSLFTTPTSHCSQRSQVTVHESLLNVCTTVVCTLSSCRAMGSRAMALPQLRQPLGGLPLPQAKPHRGTTTNKATTTSSVLFCTTSCLLSQEGMREAIAAS